MQLKKPKVFLHKGQFPNRLELSFVILSGQLANEEILHRSILGNTSIVLSVLSKVYVLLRLIFLELSSRLLKWAITVAICGGRDFGTPTYQTVANLSKCAKVRISHIPRLTYIACYQLGFVT